MLPTASAVAIPEPDTAAKKVHPMIAAAAIPPLRCPKTDFAKLIKAFEGPPKVIKLPANKKRGMATKVYFSMEAKKKWAICVKGICA
jgi:hypothetical protein